MEKSAPTNKNWPSIGPILREQQLNSAIYTFGPFLLFVRVCKILVLSTQIVQLLPVLSYIHYIGIKRRGI